jgi:hypothetical protein
MYDVTGHKAEAKGSEEEKAFMARRTFLHLIRAIQKCSLYMHHCMLEIYHFELRLRKDA